MFLSTDFVAMLFSRKEGQLRKQGDCKKKPQKKRVYNNRNDTDVEVCTSDQEEQEEEDHSPYDSEEEDPDTSHLYEKL